MAVTFDAVGPSAAGQGTAGVTSITWSHTCTGTNLYVIVGASRGGASTTLTATFGGVTMTQLGTVASGGGTDGSVYLFGLVNPPAGASTVLVTAGAARDLSGGSISFAGVDQTTPAGTAVTATSAVTSVSVNVTATTVGNMVAATACYGGGNTVTAGQTSQYSKILNGNTGAGANSGETAAGSGGTVAMSFSAGFSDNWGIVAVEVKAAAGAVVTQAKTQPRSRARINRAYFW